MQLRKGDVERMAKAAYDQWQREAVGANADDVDEVLIRSWENLHSTVQASWMRQLRAALDSVHVDHSKA